MFSVNPIWLRVLGALACCAGVLAFIKGFRPRWPTNPWAKSPIKLRDNPGDPAAERSSAARPAPREIIRLSTDPAPSTSTTMSQQERIAAAMQRAGMPNPVAWSDPPNDMPEAHTSTAVLEPPPVVGESDATIDSGPHSRHSAVWLCAGAVLVILSIYLLFMSLRP